MQPDSIRDTLRKFVAERDWDQFHSSVNLAKSIAIEAAELLECFQWSDEGEAARIEEELADVLTYAYLLADKLETTPEALIRKKLSTTESKYPADLARGKSTKYDRL
ncbi:hypothetical protein ACIFOC_00855 [Leucobacter aridicollis]|uniref:nucleotide pyrophosphohydrolase n=1 Tax=Leucobacter aridicollis TaxID=283878 RepID=UPI00216A1154|nr:nucleotide pyrophosphohydrolase [Leucobacter aridicollis]MCS3427186.1 NTP pyrophosphatase (non-canonical NTP hydrolase) [Leucobacter aridicollis]